MSSKLELYEVFNEFFNSLKEENDNSFAECQKVHSDQSKRKYLYERIIDTINKENVTFEDALSLIEISLLDEVGL
jgi:hypothetical protein